MGSKVVDDAQGVEGLGFGLSPACDIPKERSSRN